MGITGSRIGTRDTPEVAKRQLVLDQMAKDPNSRQGPATIKEGIAFSTGVHLTRCDTFSLILIVQLIFSIVSGTIFVQKCSRMTPTALLHANRLRKRFIVTYLYLSAPTMNGVVTVMTSLQPSGFPFGVCETNGLAAG